MYLTTSMVNLAIFIIIVFINILNELLFLGCILVCFADLLCAFRNLDFNNLFVA